MQWIYMYMFVWSSVILAITLWIKLDSVDIESVSSTGTMIQLICTTIL